MVIIPASVHEADFRRRRMPGLPCAVLILHARLMARPRCDVGIRGASICGRMGHSIGRARCIEPGDHVIELAGGKGIG